MGGFLMTDVSAKQQETTMIGRLLCNRLSLATLYTIKELARYEAIYTIAE